MYHTLNAAFHSFFNEFQRHSGCLRESLRQTEVFPLSTAKQQCRLSWGFPSNLLCLFFPQTQMTPAFSQQDPQHPPSGTFPLPSLSARRSASSWPQAGLASWPWPPHRDLPVPSAEPPALLAHPSSTASFPRNPSPPHPGGSSRGQDCIFRLTPRS